MNFISSHPASVFLAGLAVLVVSLALSRHGDRKLILLSLYALIVPHIFLSLDALSLLGWTVFVVLPVAGWSVSRDRAWIAVFLSLWAGLFIRRLTFYNAFAHLYLPPRWVLCALLVAAGAVFLRLQLRKAEHAAGTSAWGAASFIPAVLAIMLVPQVKVRALLLLACLIPVLRAARQAPEAKRTLAALWVAVFYLGTSSNINHLTQLVAFPLFIALWAIAGRSPAFIKGVLIGFAVWALYLLPGNALNLNISELGDTFILNSANKQSIIYTILVIAGRYLLPVTALVAGMIWSLPRAKLLPVAAGALVPFLAALGILWTKVTFFPAGGYPWQEIVRIAVVSVYLIVVIGAFVLAGALRRAHAALARRMPAWSPQ